MTTETAAVTAPRAVRVLRLTSLGFLTAGVGALVVAAVTPSGHYELAPVVALGCLFAAFFAIAPTMPRVVDEKQMELPEHRVNPATGLPMVGNPYGVDAGGNPYGVSLQQQDRFHR